MRSEDPLHPTLFMAHFDKKKIDVKPQFKHVSVTENTSGRGYPDTVYIRKLLLNFLCP